MTRISRLTVLLVTAIGAGHTSAGRATPVVDDLGVIRPATALHATIWLKRRDEAAFEAAFRAVQDPRSPQFRHWMTRADYASYAADQASVQTVTVALSMAGLTVTGVSADRQRVDLGASVAAMSRALQTPIHLFSKNGVSFAGASAMPHLQGAADTLVAAITGLSAMSSELFTRPQLDLATGRPIALALAAGTGTERPGGSPLNPFLTDDCFNGTTSADLSTAEGFATFTGRTEVDGLFASFKGAGVCGYDATQLLPTMASRRRICPVSTAAGRRSASLSPTARPSSCDINTYSQIEGLPQLGSSNFKMVAPLGVTPTYDQEWSLETTLDVTMVRAIAPAAKIVLLVAPSNDTSDLIFTFQYGVAHHLADTYSMSFGEPELGSDGPTNGDASAWTLATAEAASYGVGVTVSSGDDGDNGVGKPLGAPSVPADSPFVTAVGGTTLALPTAEGTRDVGWGWSSTEPNANFLMKSKLQVAALEAIGSGGGESVFNGKPYWQHALPGSGRQTPDLSAIADPLTGADLVLTVPAGEGFYQIVPVVGGTSAASPVLAGMSALANEVAGERVGQIAPLLPSLAAGTIADILPFSNKEPKMKATINGETLTTPDVTPQALALLPATTTAIEQIFVTRPILSETIFTYGVDTSLKVAKGWDNVTGYGEPAGLAFIEAVAYEAGAIQMTADEPSAPPPRTEQRRQSCLRRTHSDPPALSRAAPQAAG